MTMHTCPRCETRTAQPYCCGIDLTVRRRRFRMTKQHLARVHALAARKGLDEETYRLRLGALGVASSKQFTQATFIAFLRGMAALPDVARTRSARA